MAKDLLKDAVFDSAKVQEKDYRIFDGGNLYLLVKTDGKKLWQMRLTFKGKRTWAGLGIYGQKKNEVTLKAARLKRDAYLKQLSEGVNPVEVNREAKEAQVMDEKGQFHLVAYEWLNTLINDKSTTDKRRKAFERDIFPYFAVERTKDGSIIKTRQISEIRHDEVVKCLTEVQSRGAVETALRLLTDLNRLWLFALSHGYTEFNIIGNISRKDAFKSHTKKHYPRIANTVELTQLLKDIDAYKGNTIVRFALKLQPYIFLRAENLAQLRWEYIDFDKRTLTIPRSKMKVKTSTLPDFVLPLSDSAISILSDTKQLTGFSEWVFPSAAKQFKAPICNESVNAALKRIGYATKQNTHSFRGTFRALSETYEKEHGVSFKAREACLDHSETDKVVGAYTKGADYSVEMRKLIEWWSDFLDGLRGDEVKRQKPL